MFLRQPRWRMFTVQLFFDMVAISHIQGALVIVPFVQESFQVSSTAAAWVTVGYSLATAAGMLPAAFLGNVLGRKPVLLAGLLVEAACLAGLFLAPSVLLVMALRTVEGLANAMVASSMHAMVQGSFPPEQRGRSLGLMMAGQGVGVLLASFNAGLIADTLGWRYLFAFMVPVYLAGALGVALAFRDLPGARAGRPSPWRFDYLGTVTVATGLVALVLAVQDVRQQADVARGGALLGAAVLAFAAFVAIERRSPFPLVRLDLFGSPSFAQGSALTGLFAVFHGALTLLFPFYLIQGLGWSGADAGAALIAFNLGRPALSPVSGWLADRVGSRRMVLAAAVVTAGGALLSASLGGSPPLALVLLALLLSGAGFGLFQAPNAKQVYSAVPPQLMSLAPGVLALGNHGGRAMGATVGAALLTAFSAGMAVTGAFSAGLGLLTGAFALGVLGVMLGLGWGGAPGAGTPSVPTAAGERAGR